MVESTNGETSSQRQAVMDDLEQVAIAHLACHGEQDVEHPLKSGFWLGDGKLCVEHLMKLSLKGAFLAYLSACESVKGHLERPDQAIHLAATMLFVGFRSVVGTMW